MLRLCEVFLTIFLFGNFVNCQLYATNFSDVEDSTTSKEFSQLFNFGNSQCFAGGNLRGTCLTRSQCHHYGGRPSGTCANGFLICCLFLKSCGFTTSVDTYFTNPEYPITYQAREHCAITVKRGNSNICQLRLDFLEFSLASPNAIGYCDIDLFLASGTGSTVPRICGENANQHVYMDFNNDAPITLSVYTNANYVTNRRWNIKIRQISCDSVLKAPNKCLQYHDAVSNIVKSFNYGPTQNPRGPPIATRQIANTNYGVCIRMAAGYCGIEWSQTTSTSFTVSGDTNAIDPLVLGTSVVAEKGADCTKDFVIVPHPFQDGIADNTDRFCGNAFVTKTSYSKPFVLYVVTDGDEMLDFGNKGFSLTYRQLLCAI